MNHVQRGTPFCMTVGPSRVGPHDQAEKGLHQGMTYQPEPRAGAQGLLIEARRAPWSSHIGFGLSLDSEVACAIARHAVGAAHRVGLGRGSSGRSSVGVSGPGGSPGSSPGAVLAPLFPSAPRVIATGPTCEGGITFLRPSQRMLSAAAC